MTVPTFPVFVNDRAVQVPRGATVLAAVAQADPVLAAQLASGAAQATDARALPLAATDPVAAGAILRVLVSARSRRGEADAPA